MRARTKAAGTKRKSLNVGRGTSVGAVTGQAFGFWRGDSRVDAQETHVPESDFGSS